MRGASRRAGETVKVSLREFGFDAATIATLRHCSLPWFDEFAAEIEVAGAPLSSMRDCGARDRLSLMAQYAAHHAFLRFAGIADRAFRDDDWLAVRKRGSDCRLVRIRASSCTPEEAPPFVTLAQQLDHFLDLPAIDSLQQSWVRPETVYAEVDGKLRADAAADARWTRRSACGEITSPGAEVLRSIVGSAADLAGYSDPHCVAAFQALSQLGTAKDIIVVGCEFPIHRYAALSALGLSGSNAPEAEVAEQLAARLTAKPAVVVVRTREYLDEPTKRVIDIVSALRPATFVIPDEFSSLPPTRYFVLSPRLNARRLLDERIAGTPSAREWIADFVESRGFEAYLSSGEIPADASAFAAVPEPRRSYIAALALLGTSIPRDTASRFLREFLFDQPLEDLAVAGVTTLDETALRFVSDALREQCEKHIPPGSRPALCRAAAAVADPIRAAFLLIDGGESERGIVLLEEAAWTSSDEVLRTLSRLPRNMLTPLLAWTLGNALVDCGRYRDARAVALSLTPEDRELMLARVERRTGEYESALARLERETSLPFDAQIVRAEVLRLTGRHDDASTVLARITAETDEEAVRLQYERAVLALESGSSPAWPVSEHYFISRFETYRASRSGDLDAAARAAEDSVRLARNAIERIDAWLDRVFASFSAGRWQATRSLAVEALSVIDEAQGDRAAAGILFTLAYLAADEGQWSTAEHLIERLRRYYAEDALRLFEVDLLDAHLEFSRARFSEATRLATAVLERQALLPQIREAAALIIDEVNWIEGRSEPLRSKGRSGNRELDARHQMMRGRRGLQQIAEPSEAITRSDKLKLLRSVLGTGRRSTAESLARELGVDLDQPKSVSTPDLDILRIAASAEFPFRDDTFGPFRWCFASRNRLGHWQSEGPHSAAEPELDRILAAEENGWIVCSDRELLFIAGCSEWPEASREALAGIFHTRAENHRLRRLIEHDTADTTPSPDSYHGMVGDSPAIRNVFTLVDRVAGRDVPVCILGESGTGKELVARAIHRVSSRRQKTFTAVNCAALPENLIESELFGHVRGAFTGADRDRAGLIETTDGGTLFLDEIGEMPVTAQAKLLRFLQDGEFRRVGEAINRTADVRVVAATNRKLENAVEEGRFREDLYYRIRGVEIGLPPLRDRAHDILSLARHFLAAERTRHRSGPASISSEVEAVIRTYRWPGNVRELQNTVRAAHAMAGETREIELEHLPERLRNVAPAKPMAGSYQDAVARFRRDLIEKSLVEAAGNQNRAAALLNISRQALAYQIRELGIMVRKGTSHPRM